MVNNTVCTEYPICPHCGHQLDDDEMQYGSPTCDEDLYLLAIDESVAVIECPLCDKSYAVLGGFKRHYTSSFSSEDLLSL